MTEPERALEQARASVEAMRAAGAYGEDYSQHQLRPQEVTFTKLLEWAVIEPDLRDVRSTRKHGAPITRFKRLLVQLLAQYHAEVNAQQTRFNVNLVSRLRRLEERIERLEGADEEQRPR